MAGSDGPTTTEIGLSDYLARIFLGVVCVFSVGVAHLPLVRARLLPVSQAASAGLGGYTSAFLVVTFGWTELIPVLVIAGLIAGIVSWAFGLLASRLSGDRFVLATIAGQMLFLAFIDNSAALGGAQGIGGLPTLLVAGVALSSPQRSLAFALAVGGGILLAFILYTRSSHEPALRLVGQDDVYAAALGLSCWRERLQAIVAASALASLVGVIQVNDIRTVAPEMFGIGNSIAYLAVGVLGQVSILRIGLAALMYVLTPEALKLIGLDPSGAAFVRNVLFGIALVLALIISRYGGDNDSDSGRAAATNTRAT